MPLYVSASSISDYLDCPRRVHYRLYNPDAGVQNRYMLMGTVAHKVLEVGWETEQLAREVLEKEAKAVSLTQKEIAKQQHYLKNFFFYFRSMLHPDDEIEKMFKLKLYDDVYLVGKLDRISKNSVFDWKTSTTVPKNLSNSAQFIIYKYAYEKIYGSPPASLYLAGLSNGELINYVADYKFEDEMFFYVIPNMVSDIRAGRLPRFRGMFKNKCRMCSYNLDCLQGGQDVVDSSDSFT